MGRSLLQGSLLSPLLFDVFIDDLSRVLISSNKGVKIGDTKINSLIYAEDIVITSKTKEALRKSLRICERHNRRNIYIFDPDKCKVISQAFQVTTKEPKRATPANKELEYIDTLNLPWSPYRCYGYRLQDNVSVQS